MAHSTNQPSEFRRKLSVPSGRFARGTVLLECHFLCKAELGGPKWGVFSSCGQIGNVSERYNRKGSVSAEICKTVVDLNGVMDSHLGLVKG